MKRCLYFLLAVCLLLGCLSGCGHKHTWAEASCVAPKTCTECGETEGEALGHDFAGATCAAPMTCTRCGKSKGIPLEHELSEATCAAPATCKVCGKTVGETLPHEWSAATCTEPAVCALCGAVDDEVGEHQWTEPNYQEPASCAVCGEVIGEPLTPAFIAYDVPGRFIELDTMYDYRTICYEDPSRETIGKLFVTDYQVFPSDETHPAKDGYEWRIFGAEIVFDDANATDYGFSFRTCTENYYDIKGADDSVWYDEDGSTSYFTVNWMGQDYECMKRVYSAIGEWNGGQCTVVVRTAWLVPEGYDGCVNGFYSAARTWGEGEYIFDVADDDSLFFRLD